jgi:dTDP-L-rhamnose 4-epimerase
MRILLTGAAGFIGTHIGEVARERGHEVVSLDMFLDKAHGPGSSTLAEREGFEVLDLRSDRLDDVLQGIDVVCHQAAMVGNGVDAQDLPDYAEHNDAGTARLLAAMARAGVKDLVLASSMVVYGDGRYTCPDHGDVPPAVRRDDDLAAGRYDPRCPVCGGDITWRRIGEDTAFLPRTSYAASKIAQEHYASAWCTLEDARTIALPRTPRTRASRRSSAPRSRAARRPGCSRTASRCATSCTCATSPARTSSPWNGSEPIRRD